MNWQNVATITSKDLTIMMTRRSLRIGLAVLPLGLAVLFSQIIARASIPAAQLPAMLNAFLFFFMIYTGALPATLASYSLVGEKVDSFVSAEGRHEVCSLCAERTTELGWLPADEDGAEEKIRAESERKPGFFARLFARPERCIHPRARWRTWDQRG